MAPEPAKVTGIIPAHAGKTAVIASHAVCRGDHPRSRGENRHAHHLDVNGLGSSPLTRGKRNCKTYVLGVRGIIPAHAGKTSPHASISRAMRDHPRSRGENQFIVAGQDDTLGSSPLTRGKRGPPFGLAASAGIIPAHAGKTPGARHGTRRPRIIPAHAGKTRMGRAFARWLGDHPRSRGENRQARRVGPLVSGSSPLTRGKPSVSGPPACETRDHPRSRGENQNGEDTTLPRKGSSPLTRGKLPHAPSIVLVEGIIPAHAGKTNADTFKSVGMVGSSPLTRGKHVDQVRAALDSGIIPAHAGKTNSAHRRTSGRRDHPRSRGENATSGSSWGLGVGSSPLTRGKRRVSRRK